MGDPSADATAPRKPVSDNDPNLDVEILKLAAEHFRHDLRMFWEHSAFFALIDGALFSIYSSSVLTNEAPDFTLGVVIGGAGIILTLFWWWIARIRVELISLWRKQVVRVDKSIDPYHVYAEVEKYVQQHPLRSPTNVAKHLPSLMLVGWAGVLAVTFL